MSFESATRQVFVNLGLFSGTSAGTTIIPLPQTGIVARLWLHIYGTISGTLTVLNALGKASIVSRMRVTSQAGSNLFDMSGAGYHYLFRDGAIDAGYADPFGQSDARSAVAVGAWNLDTIIPLALNRRDQMGLVLLQNRGTLLQLYVDWAADATIATGLTTTRNLSVIAEMFQVPASKTDHPDLSTLHIVQEESQVVAGAGDANYSVPVGGRLIKLIHGLGIGASGSDLWTAWNLKLAQSLSLMPGVTPAFVEQQFRSLYGRARPAGWLGYDMVGQSALGTLGGFRDDIDMDTVTEVDSVITATGAGTLYTVRDLIVPLR